MKSILLLLLLLGLSRGQECSSGLLFVGGENEHGPMDTIHLLPYDHPTSGTGWCNKVNLPPLPEPISNPSVYVQHLKVVICGFSEIPCRYAEAGFTEWLPFYWIFNGEGNEMGPNETNYKMVGAFGEVLMISTKKDNHRDGRTYRNPMQMQGYPPNERITSWIEFYGSPFQLGDKNLDGSCLVARDNNKTGHYDASEVLLTGGWGKFVDCGHKCSSTCTDPGVGRWSINGNAAGNGPPDWETGFVDDMLFAREDHGCVGYKGGVLVGGGAYFETISHPMGPTERISLVQSTEFWNGNVWQQVGDLLEPRMDFKMMEFCGSIVAVGGRQYNLLQSIFLDSIEILEGDDMHWALTDIRLPSPMAKFGMAGVADFNDFCDIPPFYCQENGLFPSGPCQNGFWSCQDGIPHFLECANPLVFNPAINRCDFQENTDGCIIS